MKLRHLTLLAACAALTGPAGATLIGAGVDGTLRFNSTPTNFWHPANGFVPAGPLNAAGASVIISATDTEFGFDDGANRDTAEFTGNQLIVTDLVRTNATNWTMTFTSPAFLGISEISDTFDNGGVNFSFAGNTITLVWAGTNTNSQPGERQAVFSIQTTNTAPDNPGHSVPDGGSTGVLLALGLLGFAKLKKLRPA